MSTPQVPTNFPVPIKPRYPALDGIRAVAAFGVVATHVGFNSGRSLDDGPLAPWLARMDFGVTLFFLLSGFVIYRPFVAAALEGRDGPATGRFLLRRAARILPAYWVAIIVTFAVLSLRKPAAADWWNYLSLVQTYDGHNVDPSLTQMWTLSVELCFYLLVPLAAAWACSRAARPRAIVKRNLVLLGGMCLLAAAGNLLAHESGAVGLRMLIWLPPNLDWFALGMLLAVLSATARAPQHRYSAGFLARASTARTLASSTGLCLVLAILVYWLATLPLAGPRLLYVPSGWEWTIKHYLYALCALLAIAPFTIGRPGQCARALAWRPVRYLGQISYGIYLWHLPLLLAIQHQLHYRTFTGHFWTLFVLTSVSTVVVASLSWRLVERPVIGWASRYSGWGSGAGPRPELMAETASTPSAPSTSA